MQSVSKIRFCNIEYMRVGNVEIKLVTVSVGYIGAGGCR